MDTKLKKVTFVIVFLISLNYSIGYKAGVVEFEPEAFNQTNDERIRKAVEAYVEIIESPEANDVDIIVFPESVFNNINRPFEVPEPEEEICPCDSDDYDPALKEISCSASRSNKYVVINITSKQNGTNNDTLHYNTNVVFDRNGTVISKYRKYNLFGESGINITEESDLSYFTTDFNVTFGHFICFDILFDTPSLRLIEDYNITDIIYPTMWFSELPFLTAVQTQAMWAQKTKVNLLASGASYPHVGSTGSGVYGKDGPITSVMSSKPLRKIYIADFDAENTYDTSLSSETLEELTDLKLKRDHLDIYTSKYLNFAESPDIHEQLCYDKLCCDFKVTVSKKEVSEKAKFYQYRAVVFDGVRTYDGYATGGTYACAIIACTNQTLASCGERFTKEEKVEEHVVFDRISVSGKFRSPKKSISFPNTLTNYILPLPMKDYSYQETEEYDDNKECFRNISMQLLSRHSDLYTFGIYGRDFNKDGQKPSSAINSHLHYVLLALVIATLISKLC